PLLLSGFARNPPLKSPPGPRFPSPSPEPARARRARSQLHRDRAAILLRRIRDADQSLFRELEQDVARLLCTERADGELRRFHSLAVVPARVFGAKAPRPGQRFAIGADHRAFERPARIDGHVALYGLGALRGVDPPEGDVIAREADVIGGRFQRPLLGAELIHA